MPALHGRRQRRMLLPDAVVITPAFPVLGRAPGDTVQLAVTTVNIFDATVVRTYTWQSGNPSVMTVNGSGLVTRVALGSAVLSATTPDGLVGQVTVVNDKVPLFSEDYTAQANQLPYRLPAGATAAGFSLGWWADNWPHPPLFTDPQPRHEYEVFNGELIPARVSPTSDTVELYLHGLRTTDVDVRWTMGTMTGAPRYATFIWRTGPTALDYMYYVEHWIDQGNNYAPHPLAMSYADYTNEWIGLPPDIRRLATSDITLNAGDVVRLVTIGPRVWFFVNGVLAMYTDQMTQRIGQTSVGMGGYSVVGGRTSYRAWSVREAPDNPPV